MRHSCRCGLHPLLTLLAFSTLGSVVGIGIHLWLEPWTSAATVALGSIAGLLVSHAFGESLVVGVGLGVVVALFVLGVRAIISIMRTLQRPPTMASSRVWFSR